MRGELCGFHHCYIVVLLEGPTGYGTYLGFIFVKSPMDGTPVRSLHISCISGSVSQPHKGKKPVLIADSVSRQPPLHKIAQLNFGVLVLLHCDFACSIVKLSLQLCNSSLIRGFVYLKCCSSLGKDSIESWKDASISLNLLLFCCSTGVSCLSPTPLLGVSSLRLRCRPAS